MSVNEKKIGLKIDWRIVWNYWRCRRDRKLYNNNTSFLLFQWNSILYKHCISSSKMSLKWATLLYSLTDIEAVHINWVSLSMTLLFISIIRWYNFKNYPQILMIILHSYQEWGCCIWYIVSMYDCLRLSTTT